jgi:pyrimidine-nucleoside phosphorylase
MQAIEIITHKRDGKKLSRQEIAWFIDAYTRGTIPDYQASAWLMAIYLRGMDSQETSDLTQAMVASGKQLHAREHITPVVDKHSTGGVGDKVTLAVAPLVAACGIAVGKMSGRGLGHTGGTVDKLESVHGFRAELTPDEFLHILHDHHIVLAGQSTELAPADGKLYALRDVTGTVESIPLIAASIMSKKIAIGGSHLLLDVKCGTGAFMKNRQQARELAQAMVDIGSSAGLHTVAAITAMEQPLGQAIGNALEIREAIEILHGTGPQDVSALCLHEAAELLLMTGKATNYEQAATLVQQAIHSGAAVQKFAEVIAVQGGDARQIEQVDLLPQAPIQRMLKAPHKGYIVAIDAERIGLASMRLGAGRAQKGDPIDHRTGFRLQAKVGTYLNEGDALVEVHARTDSEIDDLRDELFSCYQWSAQKPQEQTLIYETVRPNNSLSL